ncbi:MAG: octaprenyl diphosphate synthase [SAR86 cluster bacterium]|uniref:Octaprenyl diphosphate synthase n=1 Tax=SAR86 cluster bacterium TaxID=2030880 RepID=A0A2A4MGE3_9GAMM|nr:MAG: octaprenyl diphosphate synthase [SAR86 cluster bacterium]
MYKEIRSTVEADFDEVNQYIIDQLHSQVGLVESIGHYIVDAGGKRLRPILVLLAARSCGIQGKTHIHLAAIIEFIHTATLLHDDVVDMSTLRRGRPTVNDEWNNPSSVLVGDFIYSRAFQLLVKLGSMPIMELMADTTNMIAEGEVLQLISKLNHHTTEANYMNVIRNKTAILFQAAAHSGALLADADETSITALKQYGLHLGMAFQLIDDALDYDGDAEALGKNIGDDLAEGKPTLPLIRAMAQAQGEELELIKSCLVDKTPAKEVLDQVIAIVVKSDALQYTRNLAQIEADKALACLSQLTDSPYRDAMKTLARFATYRSN